MASNSKDDLNDLKLMQLYTLYQNNQKVDGGKNSYILQIAKSIGPDLTQEEFGQVARHVAEIESLYSEQLENANFQAALWELPAKFKQNRGANWMPVREQGNKPPSAPTIDYVPSSPKLPDVSEVQKPSALSDLVTTSANIGSGVNQESYGKDRDPIADILRSAGESFDFADLTKLLKMQGTSTSMQSAASSGKVRNTLVNQFKNNGNTMPMDSWMQLVNNTGMIDMVPHLGYSALNAPKSESDLNGFFDAVEQAHRQSIINAHRANKGTKSNPMQAESKPQSLDWIKAGIEALNQTQESGETPSGVRPLLPANTPKEHKEQTKKSGLDSITERIKSAFLGKQEQPENHEMPDKVGHTFEPAVATTKSTSSDDEEDNQGTSWLDKAQMALDAIGVVEPTPFADGTNALISLFRAATNPQEAGKHLTNAGISLASMIPYFGDVAKLGKAYGKGEAKVGSKIGDLASKIGTAFTGFLGGKSYGGSNGGNGGGSGGGKNQHASGGNPDDDRRGGRLLDSATGVATKTLPLLSAATLGVVYQFRRLIQWAEKLSDKGRMQLESYRELAHFSPASQIALANFDFQQTRRDMERAKYMSPVVVAQAQAQSANEDARQKYELPYERLMGNIQIQMTNMSTAVYKIASIADPLNAALAAYYGSVDEANKDNKETEARDSLEALAQLANIEALGGWGGIKPKLPAIVQPRGVR